MRIDTGYGVWGMSTANISMPAKGYARTRGKFKATEPLTINAKFSDTKLLNKGHDSTYTESVYRYNFGMTFDSLKVFELPCSRLCTIQIDQRYSIHVVLIPYTKTDTESQYADIGLG